MSKMSSGKPKPSMMSSNPKKNIVPAVFLSVLLFFLIAFSAGMDNMLEKGSALLTAIVILGICFGSKLNERLKESACPAFFAVTAYVLLGGMSTFYALAGKFAISEFSKILIAFCIYLLVFAYTNRSVAGFRRVAVIFSSVGCLFGILSVDAASSNVLAPVFKRFFALFTTVYADTGAYQQGVRISTILGNANVYAGFMAISVILSIALVLTGKDRKAQIYAAFLLGMNALCYVLAFSMGSLFICVLAVLLMAILTKKEARADVIVLLFETGLVTLAATALSMLGLGKTGGAAFITLAAVPLAGAALSVVDGAVRPKISAAVNKNTRQFIGVLAGIVLIVAVYAVVALQMTAPAVLNGGEVLSRSIYPSAGQYTMKINASTPVTAVIDSQNKLDLMKRTRQNLFTGASEGEISFTVPDDSKIVTVTLIAASEKTTVTDVSYAGNGAQKNIALKYKLIPAIIANRLQNLGANENAVQRTVFFEDGLKMFKKSPIFGRGLGGFENGIFSVQDYFYETKYAHNHYIQALADLGIVGLAAFLSILGLSAYALFKGRKHDKYSVLVPIFSACLLQMAGQGATDVIWSSAAFLPFAFAVLALIAVFFGEPVLLNKAEVAIKQPKGKMNVKVLSVKYGISLFSVLFAVLISGNIYAKALSTSGSVTLDTLKKCAAFDAFEKNDYLLSFVLSAPASKDEATMKEAAEYAEKLRHVQSNTVQTAMIDYYFDIGDDEKAFETAREGILYTKSNPSIWSKQFDSFEKAFDPVGTGSMNLSRVENKDYFVEKILNAYKMLQDTDKMQMDDLHLSPKNNAFIGKIMAIKPLSKDDLEGTLKVLSRSVFDSNFAADVNQDLAPDALTTLSGNVQWGADGSIVNGPASIKLEAWHKLKGTYKISVLCDAPEKIAGITIDQAAVQLQYANGEAFALVHIDQNDFEHPLNVQIDMSDSVNISQISLKKESD